MNKIVFVVKKLFIIISLLFLLNSCMAGGYGPSKLYMNGKDSQIPNVYFNENDVHLPVIDVLRCLGGNEVGGAQHLYRRIQIQDKVFHYDIEKHILLLEIVESPQTKELLSEKDEPRFISWLDAEIYVDYTTLKDIFDAAGIPVEIRVDWENERIYIDTRCQGDGSLDTLLTH